MNLVRYPMTSESSKHDASTWGDIGKALESRWTELLNAATRLARAHRLTEMQAGDLLGAAMVRLAKRSQEERNPERDLFAFAVRIMEYEALDQVRREISARKRLAQYASKGIEREEAARATIASDAREKIVNAIAGLTPLQRNLIRMRLLNNMPLQKVAFVLDQPLHSLNNIWEKTLQELRSILRNSV